MGLTASEVADLAAKQDVKLTRELGLLGADPNGERSTRGGWAQPCSEVREANAGGIREHLSELYEHWEALSGESSPLELLTRDALQDSMLTFRERLVLVALIDRVNYGLRRAYPWPDPLDLREVARLAEGLGVPASDTGALIATLITRGWLQRPPGKRRPLKPALRFQVMDRDGFRCVYCGTPGAEEVLHVDHVTPVSKGGANDASNLVTACETCNLGKSASLLKTTLRLVPR